MTEFSKGFCFEVEPTMPAMEFLGVVSELVGLCNVCAWLRSLPELLKDLSPYGALHRPPLTLPMVASVVILILRCAKVAS